MKIIMYTKDKCPNCERAKFMLNYSPVPVDLEIRNIESGEKAEDNYETLQYILKSNTLPTILIPTKIQFPTKQNQLFEEDNIIYEILVGFDSNLGRLQEVLGL